jgi:hypothetical protein
MAKRSRGYGARLLLLLTVPYRPGFGAVSKVKNRRPEVSDYFDFAMANWSRSWMKPMTTTANIDGINNRYIKPPLMNMQW